jgi:single-strand DNA-binding protein
MAGSVNKVILIGNLGKDPEIRRLESGVTVASFTLATSENYLDKNSGERKEITDWHDIVMWRGLAEVAEKYLKKGMKIYVEGKLKKKNWQDKEGNVRYSTEIIAEEMTILSAKNDLHIVNVTQEPYPLTGGPVPPEPLGNLESSPDDILPF